MNARIIKAVWTPAFAIAAIWVFGGVGAVRADSEKGAEIAQHGAPSAGAPACAACHGEKGEGAAMSAPRLAGLSKAYILRQLAAFRSGARKNPIMQPIAGALAPAQSEDVADYFSGAIAESQPVPSPKDIAKQGRDLAQRGRWSGGVPACETCHAPGGVGVAPTFPYLAGQDADYIKQQINDWRTGDRSGDPLGLMKAVASRLSASDIAAVAAYYASLSAPKRQGEN